MRTTSPPPPHRAPWLIGGLLAACLGGCPKPAPPTLPPEIEPTPEQAPALSALRVITQRDVASLQAIACGEKRCAWIGADGLAGFDPATLEPGPARPIAPLLVVERLEPREDTVMAYGRCESGPCAFSLPWDGAEATPAPTVGAAEPIESVAPAEASDAPPANPTAVERATWATLMEQGRRLPFQRRVPVAGGGMVTYQRGLGPGGGKLLRIGGGLRTIDAPGIDGGSAEGWLATHPSGLELYLLLWPQPTLHAYDSRSMTPRWSLELPGPALGLFVDPAGRFAVLSLTPPPDEDRLTDLGAPRLEAAPDREVLIGVAALPEDATEATGVALVDLASHRLAAQAQGAFRGWLRTPDGAWLLAGEQQVVRLEAR